MFGIKSNLGIEKGYSLKTGLWKSIKTNLIVWAPAILALLAKAPVEYAAAASIIAYWLKNWYDFNVSKNI